MDGSLILILLSVTMFVGSFMSGLIPLTLTLSENKMRMVTVIGAGLLVGTALAVIIPEGVYTLYSNDNFPGKSIDHHHDHHKRDLSDAEFKLKANSGIEANAFQQIDLKPNEENKNLNINLPNEQLQHQSFTPHSSIGITLVLGFVFMLIVDQIGGNIQHKFQTLDQQSGRNRVTFTTTFGLVIHAAVDGLALGAAAASAKTDIEMIVFIAIMLHKAPASFGLVSFLLHEGLDRSRVRRHLTIFALAAPVMAIVTYFILNMPSQPTVVSSSATGLCMLFSAGTFLYVSTVHVLPEVQHHHEDKQFKTSELVCLIIGACLPLFLSIGHNH